MILFFNDVLRLWRIYKNRRYWLLLLTGLLFVYGKFVFWFFGSIFRYNRYEILMVMIAVIFLILNRWRYSTVKKSSAGSALGLYVLIAGLIFFLLGQFSNIETFQILSLFVVIIGLSLMVAGREIAKILIVPFLYFFISYAIFEFPG